MEAMHLRGRRENKGFLRRGESVGFITGMKDGSAKLLPAGNSVVRVQKSCEHCIIICRTSRLCSSEVCPKSEAKFSTGLPSQLVVWALLYRSPVQSQRMRCSSLPADSDPRLALFNHPCNLILWYSRTPIIPREGGMMEESGSGTE